MHWKKPISYYDDRYDDRFEKYDRYDRYDKYDRDRYPGRGFSDSRGYYSAQSWPPGGDRGYSSSSSSSNRNRDYWRDRDIRDRDMG